MGILDVVPAKDVQRREVIFPNCDLFSKKWFHFYTS